jgi:hypothetical protein
MRKKEGAAVSLTKRRLQFLQKLIDLYQKTHLPIHYEALADSIGVSKWTAYDMLKEIEKLGFVSRRYEVNTKETGRSQVMFVPTSKAKELLAPRGSGTFDRAEWERTLEKVARLRHDVTNVGINEALRKMIDEISNVNKHLPFCAYVIDLLVLYLKKCGGKTESLIRHIVKKAPSKESGMMMFIGTVLGTAMQTLNDDLRQELTELVSRLVASIAALSGAEKEMLSDFWQEAY